MSELGDALRIVSEHADAIELNADSLPLSLQARPRQKAAALRVVLSAAKRWRTYESGWRALGDPRASTEQEGTNDARDSHK